MKKDKAPEADVVQGDKGGRRPYVAPTVTDFFQPVVALGTNFSDGCATPKPPKR
jgi:hypothetical protein